MPGEKLIQTGNIWLSCTEYVISAGLLWWISLVHRRGLYTAKISASVKKKWNLEYEIMASTFKEMAGLQFALGSTFQAGIALGRFLWAPGTPNKLEF